MSEIVIPKDWQIKQLDQISEVQRGITWKKSDEVLLATDKTIPVLRIGNIRENYLDLSSLLYLNGLSQEQFLKNKVSKNDILLVSSNGNNEFVGRACKIDKDMNFVYASFLSAIKNTSSDVDPNFLLYFIRSPMGKSFIQNSTSTGVGINNLKISELRKMTVILPKDIQTQKKIVAKLDYILGKLEEKKQEIKKLKQNINYDDLIFSYKNNLLKLACIGVLTKKWRDNNPKTQPADSLLKSICSNRQIMFEQEINDLKEKGIRKQKSKFLLEPPIINLKNNVKLPNTWTHTNLDFLSFITKLAGFEYTKYFKPKDSGDVPIIKAQNVQNGIFVEKNLQYISHKTSDELPRSQINGNEILMVFIGAGTGNVCLAPSDRRWHLAPNVAKIDVNGVNREYVFYYLQSPIGLTDTLSRLQKGAQPSLSMGTIRMINVNLPPLEEQAEIVKIIKHSFEVLEKRKVQIELLKKHQEKSLINLNNLTTSILDTAFSGKLVK